ncbi:MAG: DUF4255 domain-containing protein [Thaumarchaeota archaeon]|nr:DUF4255 domain-containing protein [Nitrososphaerota archaeon]
MTNFQAIATVTATIAYLMNGIQNDVPAASITTKPPDVVVNAAPYAGLNIFLYQVNLNQSYRNLDQPARNAAGTLVKRPRLAINLEYLLTATGDGNDDIQAHQILASAMRILHENPVLTNSTIQSAVAATAEVAGSDLAYQIEQVKITPSVLTLDELTKVWSSFFQTNYRVSTAYEVTVILLDSQETPRPSLPVLTPQIMVVPFSVPIIQSLSPQVLESGPTATLTINGLNLTTAEAAVSVRINGISVTPVASNVTSAQISITVPPSVTPGVKSVQVVQSMQLAPGQPPLPLFESNVVPFVLAPTITTPPPITGAHGTDMTLSFTPPVEEGQQIDFLIGDYTISIQQSDLVTQLTSATTVTSGTSNSGQPVLSASSTAGFVVGAQVVINPGGDDEEWGTVASIQAGVSLTLDSNLTNTHTAGEPVNMTPFTGQLDVPIPLDFPPGTYLFRMRVDGAESLLAVDGSGNFASPTVQVS